LQAGSGQTSEIAPCHCKIILKFIKIMTRGTPWKTLLR
jgi:hypothetical protein